jgi:tetratricopeptide (TPR) repeat protein
VITVTALAVALAAPARATPSQDLEQANAAFRNGQFAKALPLYNALLYPPPPRLSSPTELIQAYEALGVCRVEGGDLDGARREFEKALQLDPNLQLDQTVITNKDAIKLFDDTKFDLRARAEREAARQQHALDLERQRKFLASLRVVETHQRALTFLPFGIGQFQNHDTTKGVLFAAGESITGATSFAIWGYLVSTYGFSNQHLAITPDDASKIRLLEEVEIGTGAAFLALYAWSIIDGNLHFTPQQRLQADRSYLSPDLLDPDAKPKPKKPKKTSLLERIHLAPMLSPTGVGLGLSWETN